jgi:hypothetical protein
MPVPRRYVRSVATLIVMVFTLAGCRPEEKIARKSVPRLNDMKRILAAIVPPEKGRKDDKTWFFKLSGLESQIEPLVASFNGFLKTLRFENPETPVWTLPAGWIEEKDPANKMRFATIYTGPKDKALELTVSGLQGEQAGSIQANVNRWRRQIGLSGMEIYDPDDPRMEGMRLFDLKYFLRPEVLAGRQGYVVDMIGPGAAAAPPMAPPMEQPPEPADPPFKYSVPDGWKKIAPTSSVYILSLLAVDQDKRADINVSILAGDGGGVQLNVNRWRGQVKLADLTAEQIKALPDVAIGNSKGKLVDMTGPPGLPKGNRIVGAILLRERDSLFFKMMGPDDWVGKQLPAFEAFLKSVQLNN